MSFLELKNIGKIYVQNGTVAVGIRGVNLSFDIGEFVAITGKSGAGKSTLLNVISGIDSYEEGELFIEGKETSHYLQKEWEEYRKKYISFIFQDYNIIDSYTVLQNVELSLMHIDNPIERRQQAIEYITKVGLKDKIKSKGSKLSGGEKQRTVIARALAKNSKVIIADEPTGNLDSKSSKEIIELLSEISKNRLVIVVTHNFDDFEDYATRHIRVYDGAIESDEEIRPKDSDITPIEDIVEKDTKIENLKKGFRLGKTIFFSKPKLAIFMIILMLLGTVALFFTGANYSEGFDLFKKNYMFNNIDGRMIISRVDGKAITEEELNNLKVKYNLDSTLHYDYLLDNPNGLSLQTKNYINIYFEYVYNKTYGNNIIGRYPEKENEVFLYLPISYKPDFGSKELLINTIGISNSNNSELFEIVGVKYYYDNTKEPEALFTKEGFDLITAIYYLSYNSSTFCNLSARTNDYSIERTFNIITPTFDVPRGKAYVKDVAYEDFINKFKDSGTTSSLHITCTYSKNSYNDYLYEIGGMNNYTFDFDYGTSDIGIYSATTTSYGGIYVNIYDIRDIAQTVLKNEYKQASLFFKTNYERSNAVDKLKDDGYVAVESNVDYSQQSLDSILSVIGNIFALFGFFILVIFIAFFINLVSSRSLDAYRGELGIMRSMGINVKVIKIGMYFRIIFSIIPAFLVVLAVLLVFYLTPSLNYIIVYLHWYQYVLITAGLLFLVFRVGKKQDKKLFNQSVKNAIREGNEL